MRLRHVEVFQAVMETGSMSAAGRLIHLTQSAVSRLVASAERQLGYPLFHRVSGRLMPTDEAHVLFEASSALFERLVVLRQTAAQLKHAGKGRLRVAAIPALCHKLLPDVLARFQQHHPDVVCEVRTQHKRQITEDLIARRVDVGLDFFESAHPGMQSTVVGTGTLHLMAPLDHAGLLVTGYDAATIQERLGSLPMIALANDDPVAEAFARYCARECLQPRVMCTEVQTFQLAEELVARGLGWTVVDFLTAAQSRPDVFVTQLQPAIECPVNMLLTKSHSPSLLARRFTEVVREVLAEHLIVRRGRRPVHTNLPKVPVVAA